MSFNLTDDTYVHSIWFVGGRTATPDRPYVDYMAMIYKDKQDSPWAIKWRLRFSQSDDPWDKNDKKHWHALQAPDDSEYHLDNAIRSIQSHVDVMSKLNDAPIHRLDINGGAKKASEILLKQPWAHHKEEKNDEEQVF